MVLLNYCNIDNYHCKYLLVVNIRLFRLAVCPLLQVLALPGLVWKQLIGEAVSWSKDFAAVDSVLVRIFKSLHLHGGVI